MRQIRKRTHLALIVSGGTGTRIGAEKPKQFLEIAGAPVIVHTIRRFLDLHPVPIIAVVMYPPAIPEWQEILEKYLPDYKDRIDTIAGGATRTASVFNGLRHLSQSSNRESLVAIHDAVRPLAGRQMLQKAYYDATYYGNATVAVPVKSSLRRRKGDGSEAVDRSEYFHVQTPQIFILSEIVAAYEQATTEFTDDASLAEAFGMDIHLSPGDYDNIKITTPEDLGLAEILLKKEKIQKA